MRGVRGRDADAISCSENRNVLINNFSIRTNRLKDVVSLITGS